MKGLIAGAAAFALLLGGTVALGAAQAVCTSADCAVSGDALTLAQELVLANREGRLRFLEQRYLEQLEDVAAGHPKPDCGIDVRVLQMIAVAVRAFESVGVSDLNRRCTRSTPSNSAGTSSSHWINGGGHAVDFYSLNGRAITGADSSSIRLIELLEQLVPAGARIGQSQCRIAAGTRVHTVNFRQFTDTCNHLHVDVAYTDEPLRLPQSSTSTEP